MGITLNTNRTGTAMDCSQTYYEPFDRYKRRYKNEGFNPPYSFGGHANLIYASPEKTAKQAAKKANRGHNYYPFYSPPQALNNHKHFTSTIKEKTWFTETLRN